MQVSWKSRDPLDQYNLFSENILWDKLLRRAICKIGFKAQQIWIKLADNDLQEIALTQETVARAATLSNTRSKSLFRLFLRELI